MFRILALCKANSDLQKCAKDRVISLLSVIGKSYAKVLSQRVVNSTEKFIRRGAVWYQEGQNLYRSVRCSQTNM